MILQQLGDQRKEMLNQRDHYGRTLLHFALHCRNETPKSLQYIMDAGSDVNLHSDNVADDKKAPTLLLASE